MRIMENLGILNLDYQHKSLVNFWKIQCTITSNENPYMIKGGVLKNNRKPGM